ncbi:type VI secretion system baseplate subunit TssF, partial [Escherichia coli]|nr:type VI secretion system baseplate subunit TssF [Escherichia coli]
MRLHCVPVINLFPLESDPLAIIFFQAESRIRHLRCSGVPGDLCCVQEIVSVQAHCSKLYCMFEPPVQS